jgi:hypothetical protein
MIAIGEPFVKRKESLHMAPAPCVQWGTITLILDNEAFRKGFLAAREWYFADIYGEDGRKPEEPQRATQLTSETALRLIVQPDSQGRYHFDEMGMDHLPEYLGYLVGAPFWPTCPRRSRALPQRASPTRMSS